MRILRVTTIYGIFDDLKIMIILLSILLAHGCFGNFRKDKRPRWRELLSIIRRSDFSTDGGIELDIRG